MSTRIDVLIRAILTGAFIALLTCHFVMAAEDSVRPYQELMHRDEVRSVIWNHSDRLLAVLSGFDTITIWDIDDWHVQSTFSGFNSSAVAIAWHPNQSILAVSFWDDSKIILLDVTSGDELLTISVDSNAIEPNRLFWSADGTRLANSGSSISEGIVQIWEIPSGRLVGELPSAASKLDQSLENLAIAYGIDKPIVVSVDFDGEVKRSDWQPIIAWRPGFPELITVDFFGIIRLWNVQTTVRLLKSFELLDKPEINPTGIAWNLDGTNLIVAFNDFGTGESGFIVFDNQLKPLFPFASPQSKGEIRSASREIVWHPSGDYVIINGGSKRDGVDEIAWLFDVQQESIIVSLIHPHNVSSTAWQTSGNLLATGCRDGIVRVWKIVDLVGR